MGRRAKSAHLRSGRKLKSDQSQSIGVESSIDDFMAFSSAHFIRQLYYGNTRYQFFSLRISKTEYEMKLILCPKNTVFVAIDTILTSEPFNLITVVLEYIYSQSLIILLRSNP